jgi:hypothetical protein
MYIDGRQLEIEYNNYTLLRLKCTSERGVAMVGLDLMKQFAQRPSCDDGGTGEPASVLAGIVGTTTVT